MKPLGVRRDSIASGASDIRVLEIEAVDGRSRSHASSRVGHAASQDDVCIPHASRGAPWENRADADRGQIQRRNGVRGALVIHHRIQGVSVRGASRERSIRRKTSRVEATSSLYGEGTSAALAMQVFSGNDVERRRAGAFGEVKSFVRNESTVARPAA